jgi:hypothetical protein
VNRMPGTCRARGRLGSRNRQLEDGIQRNDISTANP